MAAPPKNTSVARTSETSPDLRPHSRHERGDETAFETLHEFWVSVIKLRSALRRLAGDRPREVAAVTLRAPLQQIETAAREIERWVNARSKCVVQEVRIITPTGEER